MPKVFIICCVSRLASYNTSHHRVLSDLRSQTRHLHSSPSLNRICAARGRHQPPTTTLPKLSYHTMPSSIDNVIKMMMAINSFGPRFDPQSIPSYRDWLVNHTFDLFGPEPFSPTSNTNPGISLHARPQRESHLEESVCCIDRGHRLSGDMAWIFPQEVSYPSTVDHESNTD